MLTGGHVRWNHLHSTGDRPWYLCGRGHFAGDLSRLHCIRYHDPLTRHPYPRFRSGICSDIILALLGFFHADPLLLHLDFCRLICYNVEDLVVFLPKLMNHWMQTCTYCTWFSSLVGYTYILHWVFLTGGLKAVIYTDTLQTVIMVAGAIVLMILSKLSDIYAFTVSKKTQIYLYSPIYFNRQALTKLGG